MHTAQCLCAIQDNNMDQLEALLSCEPAWIHACLEPLLHRAIEARQLEMLQMLLEAGMPLNLEDESGRTALSLATELGFVDYVRVLLCSGSDVDGRDDDLQTPLHVAAVYNVYNVVLLLLRNGADINARDLNGNTPLHLAAAYGANEVIEILLHTSSVNVNAINDSGSTALHFAAPNGFHTIVQQLLEHGAHVNAIDHISRNTPLLDAAFVTQSMHYAIGDATTQATVVTTLLAYGAAVNATNQQGETALMGAVRNGYEVVVTHLLAHGAVPTLLTCHHETLLHVAARANVLVVSIWQQLLNAGVKLDVMDRWERTCYDIWVSRPKIVQEELGPDGITKDEEVLRVLEAAMFV